MNYYTIYSIYRSPEEGNGKIEEPSLKEKLIEEGKKNIGTNDPETEKLNQVRKDLELEKRVEQVKEDLERERRIRKDLEKPKDDKPQ